MKSAPARQNNIFSRLIAGLLLIAVAVNPLPGFAQEPQPETPSPISVEVEVTPMQATVGDLITYSIRVRHDSSIEPSQPQFVPPEGLEAVEQGTRDHPRQKSQAQREFWFQLRADRVGSYEFPALSIPFVVSKTDNGSKIIPGQLSSPKSQLEIKSVLHHQGEPTDIRDIKPLENIPRDWLPVILVVLGITLLAALGILLFLKRRKKRSIEPKLKQETLSPQETALRNLDILQNKKLLDKGRVREHYFELSEIFRRYLGDIFNFPALDWTTEEIKHFLTSSPSHYPEVREKIGFILEETDLVKFAKAQVTGEKNMTQDVINFIQETSVAQNSADNPTIPS